MIPSCSISITASAFTARSVVIASGARYRRLNVDNLDTFEGASVHYWATPLEAKLCANQEVALVGAGNSAGQAAVFLAGQGVKVRMLVRRPDLAETMSRYLVDRIAGLANVQVETGCAVSRLEGNNGMLEAVRWHNSTTGGRCGGRSAICFCSSAPIRTPIGSPGPRSNSTTKASC